MTLTQEASGSDLTMSTTPFVRVNRETCSYENLSQRFMHQTKDFGKQFAHIYAVRLEKMRGLIMGRVHQKWGKNTPVKTLAELQDDDRIKCVVIGTLFKHQELKPSILKEISEEGEIFAPFNPPLLYAQHQLLPQPSRTHFGSEGDKLILEDELQRITLVGALSVHSVVTGVVCAVLGHEDCNGKFMVEDFVWASVPEVIHRPIKAPSGSFVLLMSGIDMASSVHSRFPFQLFVNWLGGYLVDPQLVNKQKKAVRVIIAGNSARGTAPHKLPSLSSVRKQETTEGLDAVKMLDTFLEQLTRCIDVDLMPGEFDPSNHMLPQLPMHYCMFPKVWQLHQLPPTARYKTLHGVSNPYHCEVGGRRFLGTSGQPLDDIARYSKLEDPLEILEQTLEWGHLSPTSPDTLSCYPYYKEDPFIITECPDVYFAGNQPRFQTKLYEGPEGQRVRLICIPSFIKTHSCVMVDLATLEVTPFRVRVPQPATINTSSMEVD
uniref:DNA polymerase delta subunit 2 n=1 Tax=Timema poppense TaxID=170557 RepID=A0A7R9D1D7_TIMPO|nr:unnamed protein product [Timema poppensis]